MSDALRMVTPRISRAFKRGIVSMFREEGWGTAAGSLFGILLLLQMLIMLAVGVQGGLSLLRERTDLRLQIRDTATDAQVQDMYQNIRGLPYIEDVVFVTREQAYERQKERDPTLIEFLNKFGIENPFPDTMGVRLKRLEDYGEFVQFIKQPVFAQVVDPAFLSDTTDQQQQVEMLTDAVAAGRTVLLFFVGLTVIVLLFVVIELIRRRVLSKRQELFVEQLVGADRWDVLLPFMVEMILLLGVALLASWIMMAIVLPILPWLLPALSSGGMFGEWSSSATEALVAWLPWTVIIELVGVFVLAALGTMIALRPYLALHIIPTSK